MCRRTSGGQLGWEADDAKRSESQRPPLQQPTLGVVQAGGTITVDGTATFAILIMAIGAVLTGGMATITADSVGGGSPALAGIGIQDQLIPIQILTSHPAQRQATGTGVTTIASTTPSSALVRPVGARCRRNSAERIAPCARALGASGLACAS